MTPYGAYDAQRAIEGSFTRPSVEQRRDALHQRIPRERSGEPSCHAGPIAAHDVESVIAWPRFDFEGTDWHIALRVEAVRAPSSVTWTCEHHNGCGCGA